MPSRSAREETSPLLGQEHTPSSKHTVSRPILLKLAAALAVFLLAGAWFAFTLGLGVPGVAPLSRVATLGHADKLHTGDPGRMVIAGDVHGMLNKLKQLLHDMDYDPAVDRLILLGDFTTKGPHGIETVDFAIKHNAYCVRGNHEDQVLWAYAKYHHIAQPQTYPPFASPTPKVFGAEAQATLSPTKPYKPVPVAIPTGSPPQPKPKSWAGIEPNAFNPDRDMALVKALKPHHIRYIESCPAILELGQVSSKGIEAVAVHGGLMWNIHGLEAQDPAAVMRIRGVTGHHHDLPSEEPVGDPWFKWWNEEQLTRAKNEQVEVFYGHDASKGLQLFRYSKGLDTRCQRGGVLSGYTVTLNDGHYHEKLYQVDCSDEGQD